MAWFEGLSSLKGQLSNLAKGVLADDTDEDGSIPSHGLGSHSDTRVVPEAAAAAAASSSSVGDTWNEAFLTSDTFIGQDAPPTAWNEFPVASAPVAPPAASSSSKQDDEDGSVLSKGIASLLSLGKGVDVNDQLKTLQAENRALREENESSAREIRSCRRIISELESVVAVGQDENSNLSTGMEELDLQHQQAIEQVLTDRDDTHKNYEQLRVRFAELESRYKELEDQLNKPKPAHTSIGTDPFEDERDEPGKEDLLKELEERDSYIAMMEDDNARLNEVVYSLKTDLEVARESLPSIPENTEEMELKVASLENDISILREVRTNLETEVAASREQITELSKRLQETNAMLKNQENVVIDCSKLTEANAQMEQQLIHNRNYIEKLETDMKKLKESSSAALSDLKIELESKNAYITRLEEGSEASNEFLQEENSKLNKKIANLIHQTHTLDEQLERAQLDNEMKDKKLCELVFESNSQKEEFKAFKLRADEERTKLEDELKTLVDCNRKIEMDTGIKADLEKQLNVLTEKLKSLELELQMKKDSEELLGLEIHSLNEAKGKLEKMVSESYENVKLAQEKDEAIENWRSKCKSLEEKFQQEKKTAENELDALRNSLNEFQINRDLNRETVLELKKQLEEKEDELFKLNETYLVKLASAETDVANANAANASLAKKIEELENAIAESESKAQRFEESLSKQQQQTQEIEEENRKLKNEIALSEMSSNQVDALVARNKEYVARLDEEEEKILNLQSENDELRRSLELKHAESSGYNSEIQRLNNALQAEIAKSEKAAKDNTQIANSYTQLQCQIQENSTHFELVEAEKNKQISALTHEVETLKNQLEYVSTLLKSVERGEGEGQGEAPPPQKTCVNGCNETQEEVNRLTSALLREQTENKLLKNTVGELNEKISKDAARLVMLEEHLVNVEDSYTAEITAAQNRIAELASKLAQADDRARTSSTAYTSANIRANQQVESLTQQVKLLTEHKEKLEGELSKAEDNHQKQNAVITNLQAVLHQFQRDKHSDIEFETERIRQKLNGSLAKNEELQQELKTVQDQLSETKRGLAAANRLTDQLELKSQQIESLNAQMQELKTKLAAEEGKVKAAYTNVEGKVDRNLVKNLVVGYVCSPPNSKSQVLKVIAQVLDLNREERVKLGLEPGSSAQHQSLSEAFIRFLESESQPKLIVPLSRPNSTPPSRKTSQTGPMSLLSNEELPSMPQFTVGRSSAGSILKDVLKENN
ncbi:thyroid hormone receptor interactor 11 [Nesidiocoris tenuis]|uniref:Thyroid hormone receptor interactor 11 n=1 Tax=Nesidiocoris tenuis TaxID=355587 RepID=A0ABN7A8K2_9HEMI|nr:thyroid hormone receptor interactor 11 [Nesidiocoris tenuis]